MSLKRQLEALKRVLAGRPCPACEARARAPIEIITREVGDPPFVPPPLEPCPACGATPDPNQIRFVEVVVPPEA